MTAPKGSEMERIELGLLSQRKTVALIVTGSGRSPANRVRSEEILNEIGMDKMNRDDVILVVNDHNVHHIITKSSVDTCIEVELRIHNGKNDRNLTKITLNLPINSKMTEVHDTINSIMRTETKMDQVNSKLIVSGKVAKNFYCLLGDYLLYHFYWNKKYNRSHKKFVIDAFLVAETVKKSFLEPLRQSFDLFNCIPDKEMCKKLPQQYYRTKRTNSFKGLTKNYKKLKFCIEYVPEAVLPTSTPTSTAR